MSKIYDCFSFFNELDLLEIRLHTLNRVADYFVLVEATRTFQKKEKPLYFQLNKKRFEPFLDKIIHIVVDTYPGFFRKFRIPTPWDYDTWQKNKVSEGLTNCQPDDIILFSDVDEIPNPDAIPKYAQTPGFKTFEQKHYYYFLDCLEVNPDNPEEYAPWNGTTMVAYRHFKNIDHLRLHRDVKKFPDTTVIKNGGWHFAYLGGVDKIIQKIESYAHTEHNKENFKNPDRIKKLISDGKSLYGDRMQCTFVSIDSTYPEYISKNQHLFRHLCA